jgi:hypothetical protein
MTYLLNQSLPLWLMLMPLGIAALLAAKLCQWQSIFSKMKANYQMQLREAQNRLDAALNSESENIERLTNVHREKLHAAESELAKYKLAIRQADDNLNDVRLTWSAKSEKDAEIIRNLNSQSVEREALIKSLNSQIGELTDKLNFNECIISGDSLIQKQLRGEIEKLQADLNAAIGVINRTKRAAKQWHKYKQSLVLQRMEEIREAKTEKVVHGSLGNARVFEADQSESVNNRHTVVNICNEVNRGIAEQAERIRQELEVVDMSKLESGDSVKFRSGAIHEVKNTYTPANTAYFISVVTKEGSDEAYCKNGNRYNLIETPSDIVQIIKPVKQEVKFAPQEGEMVHIKELRGNFKVKEVSTRGDGYLLTPESNKTTYFRFIRDLIPIKGYRYANGFISTDTCYKSNKPCEFGCNGLCKDA